VPPASVGTPAPRKCAPSVIVSTRVRAASQAMFVLSVTVNTLNVRGVRGTYLIRSTVPSLRTFPERFDDNRGI